MGMRTLARAAMLSAAVAVVGAIPAAAQTVTFSTSGVFNGAGCGTNVTICNFGGFTLSFTGQPSASYGTISIADELGMFTTACTGGSLCNTPTSFPTGVTFTLTINQTSPTGGTGTFAGTVSGTINVDPTTGKLVWSPQAPLVINIGGAQYTLITDLGPGVTGDVGIAAPKTVGDGTQSSNTTLHANVTTVPEPASIAFMATGLLGLIPVARRRRSNN